MPENISLNSLLSNFYQNPKVCDSYSENIELIHFFFELVLPLEQARISVSCPISAPPPLTSPSPCPTLLPTELSGLKSISESCLTFQRRFYIQTSHRKCFLVKSICCGNAVQDAVFLGADCDEGDKGPQLSLHFTKNLKKESKSPTSVMFGWWIPRCVLLLLCAFACF